MVKICIISICAKKLFFGKIICSTHQRKCFSTMLRNFWKIEFLKEYRQARTLQKWWKCVLSQFVLRKYFLAKLFVPLIKGRVSPQFYAIFGKLKGIFGEICIILICAKKIFFGKIIYSTHQKKCFSTILGNFWKIEFLKEYRQVRTLLKRKYFLVPLIKRKILGNFWKIEFLKEYRQARTLQKWWKFA